MEKLEESIKKNSSGFFGNDVMIMATVIKKMHVPNTLIVPSNTTRKKFRLLPFELCSDGGPRYAPLHG